MGALARWAANLVFGAATLTACGGATAAVGGGATDAGLDAAEGAVQGMPDGAADAPATVTLDCVPDAGTTTLGPGDPGVPDILRGTNGVFSDACDAQGNLVDYSCETTMVCGPGPNPDCTSYTTGKVISQPVDCAGHCQDGRCDSRCPAYGQRFHYVAVGAAGAPTIANDSDGRTYVCTLIFDSAHDSYDCATGPTAGVKGTITSLGMHGSYCTGKDFGNIGVTIDGVPSPDNESCTYSCGIL